MASPTLGDLASSFRLRHDTVRLRGEMQRLTAELSTGHKADKGSAVGGDFGPIAGMEHQLALLKGFGTAADEAALFTEVAQHALGRVHTASDDLSPLLFVASASAGQGISPGLAAEARNKFEESIGALKTQVGGRALFAGAVTDRAALPAPQAMLAELQALVAGETTAAGVAGQLELWFGPGGGFEAAQYAGSATPLAPFRVGDGAAVRFEVTATDPALRGTLKGLALAALLDGGPLAGDSLEQSRLAALAARR